jgi:hypothetical protein
MKTRYTSLDVSKVIYVGMARLEMRSKQACLLLFCDWLLIDIFNLKVPCSNVTADRNLFCKKKSFFVCHLFD